MTAADTRPLLSTESPWPGLDSFGEGDFAFFRGRDQEAQDLLQEVLRSNAVVLYGTSGTGKTSLVRAALSVLLTPEGYFLVPVRLAYGPNSPPIAAQISSALAQRCPPSARRAAPRDGESLWEYLHRREPAIEGIQPLFFFDQFEELFTTGSASELHAEARVELKALIEGTAPPEVRDRLTADPPAARTLTLQQHRYRVLIAIRDDFVAQLELLRTEIPSVVQHRFGLLPLRGDRALDAVMQIPRAGAKDATAPGPALVERKVAEQIVRTVASTRELDTRPLSELQVEPALLSVMCQELNLKRLKRQAETASPTRISSDLVTGNRAQILTGFYERAVADVPDAVRRFIEDRLVTELGYRTAAVREEALVSVALNEALLAKLVDRRLLRTVERSGVLWIELTHDVLTRIVTAKRLERRQRELAATREQARAKRRQKFAIGFGVCVAATIGGLAWYSWERSRVAESQHELARIAQRAADSARAGRARARELTLSTSLAAGHEREALAELALSARIEPNVQWKRLLLVDMLRHGSWSLPLAPLFPPGPLTWVTCAKGAARCAAAYRDGRVLVRGDATLDDQGPWKGYAYLVFSKDGDTLFGLPEASGDGAKWKLSSRERTQFPSSGNDMRAIGADAGVVITSSGDLVRLQRVGDAAPIRTWRVRFTPGQVAVSSNGRRAAFQDTSTSIVVVDGVTGQSLGINRNELNQISALDVSPTGDLLAIGTSDGSAELVSLPDGAVLGTARVGGGIYGLSFLPGGQSLTLDTVPGALFSWRKPWSLAALRELSPVGGARWAGTAAAPSGKLLAGARRDGTVRAWEAASGISNLAPLKYGAYTLVDFLDDQRLVAISLDGSNGTWKLAQPPAAPILNAGGAIVATWFDGETNVHLDTINAGLDWSNGSQQFESRRPGCSYLSRDRRHRVCTWTSQTELEAADGSNSSILGGNTRSVAFSRQGTRLATVIDEQAQLWSVAEPPRAIGPALPGTMSAWLSRDGSVLATTGAEPGLVLHSLLDNETYSESNPLPSSDVISSVAFDATGQRLVVASEGTAKVFDRRLGAYVGHPLVHRGDIRFVDFSPDGRWIVTTSVDRTARVWDAATGDPVSDWLIHRAGVNAADFSPDGRRLLTGDDDGNVRIWDILSGEHATDAQAKRLATLAELAAGIRIDPDTDSLIAVDQRDHVLAQLMVDLGLQAPCSSAAGGATRTGCEPEMEQLLAAILSH